MARFQFDPDIEALLEQQEMSEMPPEAPAAPSPKVNPKIVEYFKKSGRLPAASEPEVLSAKEPALSDYDKFKSDFGDEKLKEAQAASDDQKSGLGWAQFGASFGDAMAGRSPSETAKNFDAIRKGIDEKNIGGFEKRRAAAIQDISAKKTLDASDPNSKASIAFKKMMEVNYPGVVKAYGDSWADVSAADQENIFNPLRLKEQTEARKEAARLMAQTRKDALEEKQNVGQREVDKTYAKDYNSFTQKGAVNAKAAIDNLEALASEIEGDTGFGEAGGGRVASVLPDVMRSRDAIRRRDQARNFANTTLKELFGGQLSDAEREAAAKEYYNDALDNTENSKIIRQKIKQLRSAYDTEMKKAKFFENHKTLEGFKGLGEGAQVKFPMQVRKDGHVATVSNEQELKEANADGWQ